MTSVTVKMHLRPYNFNNTGQENHNYIPTSKTVQLVVRALSSTLPSDCYKIIYGRDSF